MEQFSECWVNVAGRVLLQPSLDQSSQLNYRVVNRSDRFS